MRDQSGKHVGWALPYDHFETKISNFFDPQLEEIIEVKYPESYQSSLEVLQELCTRSGVRVLQSWEQSF
jgi:hypothetical protein